MKPVATLSANRQRVHMRRGGWSIEFPVSELPRWLQLYRDLRDRKDRKWAGLYAPDVVALERIEIELRSAP